MNNSQYYEEVMPELVPLDKKPSNIKNSQSTFRSRAQQTKANENPVVAQASSVKMQELDRLNSKKKDDTKKQRSYELQKANEYSKNLIS